MSRHLWTNLLANSGGLAYDASGWMKLGDIFGIKGGGTPHGEVCPELAGSG